MSPIEGMYIGTQKLFFFFLQLPKTGILVNFNKQNIAKTNNETFRRREPATEFNESPFRFYAGSAALNNHKQLTLKRLKNFFSRGTKLMIET